jgi:hypothetical protein
MYGANLFLSLSLSYTHTHTHTHTPQLWYSGYTYIHTCTRRHTSKVSGTVLCLCIYNYTPAYIFIYVHIEGCVYT